MFSKLAVFIAAAALVAAVPAPGDEPAAPAPATVVNKTTNKCNVGTLQCCKAVGTASSQAVQNQAGILNIALGAVQGVVGVNCTPISAVVGVGAGANCNATPVCCKGNSHNGLVALGCGAVNANA